MDTQNTCAQKGLNTYLSASRHIFKIMIFFGCFNSMNKSIDTPMIYLTFVEICESLVITWILHYYNMVRKKVWYIYIEREYNHNNCYTIIIIDYAWTWT